MRFERVFIEINDMYFNVTRITPIVKYPSRNFKPRKSAEDTVLFSNFFFKFLTLFFFCDGYFGCMLYEFHNSPVKETKNDRGFASYRSGLHFTEKEIESAVFQNTEGKTFFL